MPRRDIRTESVACPCGEGHITYQWAITPARLTADPYYSYPEEEAEGPTEPCEACGCEDPDDYTLQPDEEEV